MRNLARLNAGARNQIKRCLDGTQTCLLCDNRGIETKASIAVESVLGQYLPACEEHGTQAEKLGWKIVRKLED